jgi:AraC-like DNA-binding protein
MRYSDSGFLPAHPKVVDAYPSGRTDPWHASRLLGKDSDGTCVSFPPLDEIGWPGGLAVSQANRALRYIEGNLGSKVAIRGIADCLALSARHFSRAFKQSLGSSPCAYVAARRVERAKLMMTSTRERLAYIALACGFSDQPHLNKSFRRVVGMSPGVWRRTSINDPTQSQRRYSHGD